MHFIARAVYFIHAPPCMYHPRHPLTTCSESNKYADTDPNKQLRLIDTYKCNCVLGPFQSRIFAARTLNATGRSRVTISLR